VLLKGINDDVEILALLFRSLYAAKVKPYYLHHPDAAPGTSHFRLSIEEGRTLVKALWSRVPGPARPIYVRDPQGGTGKVPI
jgi:lysine 2,3-aminomutase